MGATPIKSINKLYIGNQYMGRAPSTFDLPFKIRCVFHVYIYIFICIAKYK